MGLAPRATRRWDSVGTQWGGRCFVQCQDKFVVTILADHQVDAGASRHPIPRTNADRRLFDNDDRGRRLDHPGPGANMADLIVNYPLPVWVKGRHDAGPPRRSLVPAISAQPLALPQFSA